MVDNTLKIMTGGKKKKRTRMGEGLGLERFDVIEGTVNVI